MTSIRKVPLPKDPILAVIAVRDVVEGIIVSMDTDEMDETEYRYLELRLVEDIYLEGVRAATAPELPHGTSVRQILDYAYDLLEASCISVSGRLEEVPDTSFSPSTSGFVASMNANKNESAE